MAECVSLQMLVEDSAEKDSAVNVCVAGKVVAEDSASGVTTTPVSHAVNTQGNTASNIGNRIQPSGLLFTSGLLFDCLDCLLVSVEMFNIVASDDDLTYCCQLDFRALG